MHSMHSQWTISAITFLWCHTTNGRVSVGTLYRELLGEVVVHYDSGCIIEKGLRWGFCAHLRFLVCFPVRNHLPSSQDVYYSLWYLVVPCLNCCKLHFLSTLCAKTFIDPTLAPPFFQLWRNCGYHLYCIFVNTARHMYVFSLQFTLLL